MPTNLPNRAQLSYTFGANAGTTVSNLTNTTLNDVYTMTLTKTPLSADVAAGDNATYVLRLENTGAGNLYNPTVTDNLGNAALTIAGDALFYYNGTPVAGTQTPAGTGIIFASTQILEPGDNLVIVYNANVADNATGELTNTATATANGGQATGDAITATDTGTITVTTPTAASLAILKAADKDVVVPGETLTYTFTVINTGTQAADSITFTDSLPPEFTATAVSYTANGVTTQVTADDYTLTGNTLTLPAADSALVISVPAADTDGPGVVTITVSGTVA